MNTNAGTKISEPWHRTRKGEINRAIQGLFRYDSVNENVWFLPPDLARRHQWYDVIIPGHDQPLELQDNRLQILRHLFRRDALQICRKGQYKFAGDNGFLKGFRRHLSDLSSITPRERTVCCGSIVRVGLCLVSGGLERLGSPSFWNVATVHEPVAL